MTIAAFTGSRPSKLAKFGGYNLQDPRYQVLRDEIKKRLIAHQTVRAISGMALGIDQLAAQVCIEVGIPFVAAIPCDGHEKIWPEHSQVEYHRLLNLSAEKVIVSPGPYAMWKLQARNCWMVDRADVLIACWDYRKGGTANCLQYASECEKKTDIIDYRLL